MKACPVCRTRLEPPARREDPHLAALCTSCRTAAGNGDAAAIARLAVRFARAGCFAAAGRWLLLAAYLEEEGAPC